MIVTGKIVGPALGTSSVGRAEAPSDSGAGVCLLDQPRSRPHRGLAHGQDTRPPVAPHAEGVRRPGARSLRSLWKSGLGKAGVQVHDSARGGVPDAELTNDELTSIVDEILLPLPHPNHGD